MKYFTFIFNFIFNFIFKGLMTLDVFFYFTQNK